TSMAHPVNARSSIDASNPCLRRWGEVTELHGPHRGLGTVRHAELVDDPLDVHLDGADADEQALADFRIRLALRHQAQHIELALSQFVAVLRWLILRRSLSREAADELRRQLGVQWRFAT